MSHTAPVVNLGVVETIEEKIRLLITAVERNRTEVTKLRADNERLGKEVDGLKAQLTDAAGVAVELQTMREERDQVRGRVSQMLAALDQLQL